MRKHAKASTLYKFKLWSTGHADKLFSIYIRTRDPFCRRCISRPSSDCSHYWLRKHSGTRFDPNNCVGLCRLCHDYWEHEKNNEYKDFMIQWLGRDEYDAVETRSRTFKKRVDAVLECMSLLRQESLTV